MQPYYLILPTRLECEYIVRFHSSECLCAHLPPKKPFFYDFRYKEAARAFTRAHSEWRFVEAKENDFSILKEFCPAGSIVGFQSTDLSVDRFDRLSRSLKKRRFIKLADSLTNVLASKQEFEIDLMHRAALIGDDAFARTLDFSSPGKTEKEVAYFLEQECRNGGSEKPSFDTIVLFGDRCALPHGKPSDRTLKKGSGCLLISVVPWVDFRRT